MNRFKIQYALVVVLPLLATWIITKMMGAQLSLQGIGIMPLAMAISLFCGVTALLVHYLKIKQAYLGSIVLAIIFAIGTALMLKTNISLFSLVFLNVLFAGANLWPIRDMFYRKELTRIRLMLFAIAGGISYSVYLSAIYYMMNLPLMSGFWSANITNGIIIYVIIGFGLSVADLIILKTEVTELRKPSSEEDEDAL